MAKPLSDLMPALTKDILGKKSLLFGKMLAEWPAIAGADVAAKATPLELKYAQQKDKKSQAVLHLAVQAAFALELSYQKSLLIERLNMFFGYPAVKDIKFIQQTQIMSKKPRVGVKSRPISMAEEQKLSGIVADIQENDLQMALKNLGKAILSRQTTK